MTDPKRLLLAEGSQEERELLAAGAAEEPPAEGAKRLSLALGLGAGFDVGMAQRAQGQGAAQAKLWSAKLGLKAGALVLGAGGALVLMLATRTPRSEPVHEALKAPPAASAPVAPSPAEDAPAHDEASAPSIADEIARLDAARARLAAKDSARALTELDAYARRYPHGTLLPEAARLRVEAVLAQGDRARAEALARDFLRAYPESPHAPALRSVLARTRRTAHEE